MSQSIYKFFSREELSCNCGCGGGEHEMDRDFMEKLIAMRQAAGFPFPVNSAYRCPRYNSRVSSTGRTGPHTTGRAVDILVPSFRVYQFLKLAYEFEFTGMGHGLHKGFIHLDDLTKEDDFLMRPNGWSY